MSKLVVKDNALMNASYNLDLVEQRLILLAIVEARESGKGINANDPLTVHAESYINQFNVARQTAYILIKNRLLCDEIGRNMIRIECFVSGDNAEELQPILQHLMPAQLTWAIQNLGIVRV